MKTQAIVDARNLEYVEGLPFDLKCMRLKDAVSACALAFILDPGGRDFYKERILSNLQKWETLREALDPLSWTHAVPPSSAFFNSVLALDVIWNALSPIELETAERRLEPVGEWFWSATSLWPLSTQGGRGIWALYSGDRARIDSAKVEYRRWLLDYLSEDGVFNGGPGYAWARLSGTDEIGRSRDAKTYFLDVLEFTGEDTTLYSNPQIRGFYEWLSGYAVSPSRRLLTFGDTSPNWPRSQHINTAGLLRAYRFSRQAGEYAAWALQGTVPRGRLLDYALLGEPLAQPRTPPSRIFPDGGAFFREGDASEQALSGALWNCRSSSTHSHKDVNAVHLCAYGEHILRNSGYAGYGVGALGFSWDYVHDEAVSGNTLLLGGLDHAGKEGAGILQGFTAEGFDYACGLSDSAVIEGEHERSLILVHGAGEASGYFLLLDEVCSSLDEANLVLHPNSNEEASIGRDGGYQWRIGPQRQSDRDVHVSVLLGTAPENSEMREGLLASFHGDTSFVGQYLFATYRLRPGERRNMVTAIFPHDASHPRGNLSRVSAAHCSGVSIRQGDIHDLALESSGEDEVEFENLAFNGSAMVCRQTPHDMVFCFLRNGTYFTHGAGPSLRADDAITAFWRDGRGWIASPGTQVTFVSRRVAAVRLDGRTAERLDGGWSWIRVAVPEGTHAFELEERGGTLEPALALKAMPNPFADQVEISYYISLAGLPVTLELFDVEGRRIRALDCGERARGWHTCSWAARNEHGKRLAAGVYLIRLRADGEEAAAKVLLLP